MAPALNIEDDFRVHVRTKAKDGDAYLTFTATSAVTVIAELFRTSSVEVCIFLADLPYEVAFHQEVLDEAKRFLLRRPDHVIRIMIRTTALMRGSRPELVEALRVFRKDIPSDRVYVTRIPDTRVPFGRPFNFVRSHSGSYWLGKGPWAKGRHEGTYQFGPNHFSVETLQRIIDRDGQGFRPILRQNH